MVQPRHVNGSARVILGLLLAGWTASAAGSKQQEPSIETKRDATELQTVRCDRHLAGVDFRRVISVHLADNTTGSQQCLAMASIKRPRGEPCWENGGHRLAVNGYYNDNDQQSTFVEITAAKTATDDLRAGSYVCVSSGAAERQTWGPAVTWEQADMFDCLVRSDDSNTHYSIKFKMQDGGSEARVVVPDSSNGSGVPGYSVFRRSQQSFTAASPVLYSLSKWPGYARLVVVVSASVTAEYGRMTCEVEESSGKSWTREYSRPDDGCLGITTPSEQLRSPDGEQPHEDTCGKFCAMIVLACSVLSAVIVLAIAIAVYCIKKRSPRSPSQRNGTEVEDEIDLLCNRKTARRPQEPPFPISETNRLGSSTL